MRPLFRRALQLAAAFAWFSAVFLLTTRLTFPSSAVITRLKWEAQQSSAGRTTLDMKSLGPWWLSGLRATGIRLYEVDPRKPDDPATLKFAAEDAGASVSLFGLLRGRPNLSGFLTAGTSTIDWALGLKIDRDKTKGWSTTGLEISAPDAKLEDLAALLPIPLEASGPMAIAVDVQGTDGVKDAAGTASIKGQNLVISSISIPGMEGMDLGQELPIDNLDLELEVKDGRATITTGAISSSLATIALDGDITLRDDLLRSHVRINATVELGADLSKFAAFAGDAKWSDDKLHFVCSGYLQAPSCRADREGRRDRVTSRGAVGGVVPPEPLDPTGMPLDQVDDAGARRTPRSDDVRDRLRKRREEREAARGATAIPSTDEPSVPADEPNTDETPPLDAEPAPAPEGDDEPSLPQPEEDPAQ